MYRFFQKNLILVVIGLYSKKIKLKSVKGNIKLKLQKCTEKKIYDGSCMFFTHNDNNGGYVVESFSQFYNK